MSHCQLPSLRHTLGFGQALAAVVEFLFDGHAIGDVADDRAGSLLALVVEEDLGADLDLDRHAITADHPRHATDFSRPVALHQHRLPPRIGGVGQPLTPQGTDLGLGPQQDPARRRVGR